ncbi:hypothetical protein ES705_33462 [subsurface metagenome]
MSSGARLIGTGNLLAVFTTKSPIREVAHPPTACPLTSGDTSLRNATPLSAKANRVYGIALSSIGQSATYQFLGLTRPTIGTKGSGVGVRGVITIR